MRKFLASLIFCISAPIHLLAQELPLEQSAGFLQVVNLVSQKTPTYLALDEFAFNRGEPILVGGGSGTLALQPGEFELTLTNEIAEEPSVNFPVTVENGRTTVVICFDKVEVLDDGSEEVTLSFSQLIEAPATESAELTLVSLVESQTISLTIGNRSFRAAAKAPIRTDISNSESTTIKSEGKTLIDFDSDRAGHYIVFLFNNPESGEIDASLIHNEKLEYQPPLED